MSVVGGDQATAPKGVMAVSQALDPLVRMFTDPETVVPDMPPAT